MFEDDDDYTVMIDKLCAEFEHSLPLFNRRQHFFDMRGKSEALYTYMIKLQLQAMAAKLDTLTLDRQLTHKLMSDEGVSFHKKVVQRPMYQKLLEITRFDEDKKTISGEQGKANAAKGGGSGGRVKKKKERPQSPAGGKRSQTPAATALISNTTTFRHTLNRVSIKIHKMDVRDKTFKVNSSKGASGKLRTIIAKMSAAQTGKTSKERITLDMGATCSIIRLNIARKLRIDICPAPGVTIIEAGVEELKVAGQSDVFFSIFDNTPVRVHLFVCEYLNEDVLILANHLKVLGLILESWPHCLDPKNRKRYSSNYTAKSAAMEEDSGVDTEPECEAEVRKKEPPLSIPKTRVNLEEELWSDCGEVKDIPHIEDFPATTRAILFKYGNVFKTSLSKARKMKCEPVHLELDPDIPIPPPATKCHSVPVHWKQQYDKLLDTFIAEGRKQEAGSRK